jgi:hypothetical protein
MTSVQDQGRVTIPVAQTALWVAVERIKETKRPDSIHQGKQRDVYRIGKVCHVRM